MTTTTTDLSGQLTTVLRQALREWAALDIDNRPGVQEEDFLALAVQGVQDAEVERLRAENTRVRDLHYEWKIYDDCGHEHEETEKGVTNVIEVGVVCAKGYMYSVCHHCCIDAEGFQTEECVSEHEHDKGSDICETRRVLDGVEVTV